jgi:hypothetical protein
MTFLDKTFRGEWSIGSRISFRGFGFRVLINLCVIFAASAPLRFQVFASFYRRGVEGHRDHAEKRITV